MITVLVAEDHPLVRRGIIGFLSTQPDLAVVAEAGDGAEALRLATEHHPDVALVDLQLPRIDGVETIRRLTRDCPGTRVVVLTSHESDADVLPAIHAGALSYLLKEAMPDELAAAVRSAAAGEACCIPGWRPGSSPSCGPDGRRRPTRCAISPSASWRCCGYSARG
ncbi:MAG: response regulator [Pseudonocardiaceae bacterium]